MAIEDLEKALDLSTFKILTSFWLFLANKNKASKDIYNVSLHQLCEKKHKIRELLVLEYFRNMKESAVFMKELAKNGQLEKHFYFYIFKKIESQSSIPKQVF
jgi:hypothetical protein